MSADSTEISITGTSFGTALPVVDLNGMLLTVTSHTATSAVCLLSGTWKPGTYLLTLTNEDTPQAHNTASFDLTVGSAARGE